MDAKPDPRLLSRRTKQAMGGGLNEVASSAPTSDSFGARMLAKFGWKEGEGLGKKGQGMSEHIRVKQRKDGVGLGADAPQPSEWAAPALPAAPPAATRRRHDGSSDDDSDSEDEAEAAVRRKIAGAGSGVIPGMSDEDLFKACGGAMLGRRAHPGKKIGMNKQARLEEADRKYREELAAARKSGSSADATSSGEAMAAAAAVMAAKERRAAKKRPRDQATDLLEETMAPVPVPVPRASPRLQAQQAAKAAAAVPELALEPSTVASPGLVGTDREGEAAVRKAEKAAEKAAKKAAKEAKRARKAEKEAKKARKAEKAARKGHL